MILNPSIYDLNSKFSQSLIPSKTTWTLSIITLSIKKLWVHTLRHIYRIKVREKKCIKSKRVLPDWRHESELRNGFRYDIQIKDLSEIMTSKFVCDERWRIKKTDFYHCYSSHGCCWEEVREKRLTLTEG